MPIDYIEQRYGERVAICTMPDGSRAVIPAWMLDRVACATLTTGRRRCALDERRGLPDMLGRGDFRAGLLVLAGLFD